MKLEKDPSAAPGKLVLIEAIITNEVIQKQEKKKKKVQKVSKTKPDLVKGVEYQDVFQHYYLEELVEFAKKNGLKVSGTKKELIQRIIAWLEGDKENTLAGTKKHQNVERDLVLKNVLLKKNLLLKKKLKQKLLKMKN